MAAMKDIKDLLNNGIVAIRCPDTPPPELTFVVMGIPRGGTSMLAGALHHLGLFMGEMRDDVVFEDLELIRAIKAKREADISTIIASRNEKYQRWGWKQVEDREYFFEFVLPKLRCPFLVVVFRDLLVVGNRNSISVGANLFESMLASTSAYLRLIIRISETAVPAVLVSYEKAILEPKLVVHRLADLLMQCDVARVKAATEFIKPSPSEYLLATSRGDSVGCLDRITPTRITGWALSKPETARPVKVVLSINHRIVADTEAGLFRPDLQSKGIHPTGCAGFQFLLTEQTRIAPGDIVSVRIEGELSDLTNSPRRFLDTQ